jgi:nitrite reductase/ring-hydroxylating ferredoxin subunit
MAEDQAESIGPDLSQGVPPDQLADGGKLLGRVGEEEVLLARQGMDVFAIGAHCSHYHGPLADGLIGDGQVRCPWHHACFDLRTGEALRAPALSPVDAWRVEQRDGKAFVREKRPRASVRAAWTGRAQPDRDRRRRRCGIRGCCNAAPAKVRGRNPSC